MTGESFQVTATVFGEGHAAVAANVVLTDPEGRPGPWTPMRELTPGTDRWGATVTPDRPGRWTSPGGRVPPGPRNKWTDAPGRSAAMTTNRVKYFRFTPRTARITFMYVAFVPTLFGILAYQTDVSEPPHLPPSPAWITRQGDADGDGGFLVL